MNMNFEIIDESFFIKHGKECYSLCFKIPPKRRSIGVYDDDDDGYDDDYNTTRYFLSFPEMIFNLKFVKNQDFFTFFQAEGLLSVNNKLYYSPLKNSDKESICVGILKILTFKKENLDINIKNTIINDLLHHFWSSDFNNDLSDNFHSYKNASKQIANYSWWQEKTKADPNWIPTEDCLIELKGSKFVFGNIIQLYPTL